MSEDHDEVFRALANRNRRRLLDRLRGRDGLSQAELVEGLGISQQAVAQHLEVLESAGLVTAVREGREKRHYLNPVPIHSVADRWIRAFDRHRLRALKDLKRAVEDRHMTKPSFVYTIYIRATAEEVWRGLTEPEFTRKYWWHDNDSTWEVGAPWEHRRTDEEGTVDIVGEVLESDRPHRLVLTWARPEDADNAERTSRVTFEIEPQDWPGGPWMCLRVLHADMDQEMHDSVSYGWPGVCSGLKTLLESPHIFETST